MTDTPRFADLGLDQRVVAALARAGLTNALAVQAAAIPAALGGRDVVVSAQTGSGKTLAYLAPVESRLVTGPRRARVMRSAWTIQGSNRDA